MLRHIQRRHDMKVKIGKYEIEGTPEEIAAIIRLQNGDATAMPIAAVVPDKKHGRWPHNPSGIRYCNIVRGQPPEILAEMFTHSPVMMDWPYRQIKKAYMLKIGSRSTDDSNLQKNIAKGIKIAKKLIKREKKHEKTSSKTSSGTEQEKTPMPREHVRVIRSPSYVKRNDIEEIISRLPATFSVHDVMRRYAEKIGMRYEDNRRFLHYNAIYHMLVKICGRPIIKGHGGKTYGYSSFTKPLYRVTKTEDSAIRQEDTTTDELPYEPIIISKATLDSIMNTHQAFGADSLIGYSTKNGGIMKENDAIYCFKHMMENLHSLQGSYPSKRLSISGSGRYKVIEVRA
jgi:hypothetical protein